MTYQKPELLHIGSASLLIRGNKPNFSESESLTANQGQPDSDLDD